MSRKRSTFVLLMLFVMGAVFATSMVSVKGSEGEPETLIGNEEVDSPVDGLNSRMFHVECACTTLADPPCPWDLDFNGTVNVTDLLILLSQFDCECNSGTIENCTTAVTCPSPPGGEGIGDFNGNHIVDTPDLDKLLENWGSCGGEE